MDIRSRRTRPHAQLVVRYHVVLKILNKLYYLGNLALFCVASMKKKFVRKDPGFSCNRTPSPMVFSVKFATWTRVLYVFVGLNTSRTTRERRLNDGARAVPATHDL